MTSAVQIVAEARRWVDAPTPYKHQGRRFGVACDCGGLVGGVASAIGVIPSTWWADVFDPLFGGYSRLPSNGTLERICESFMVLIDRAAMMPGDVLLMRFKSEPQHLAILADHPHGGLSVIHALRTVGRVAEHTLSAEWASRIVAVYRMPGVA